MSAVLLFLKEFLKQQSVMFIACVVGLGAALGIALSVTLLPKSLEREWVASYAGIDAVLAPPTSELQAVLSLVTQVDEPAGLIDLSVWERFRQHPAIAEGYPVAYGDNYQGFRVVGVERALFDSFIFEDGSGFSFAAGNAYASSDMAAVVGSAVAESLEFQIGRRFEPIHGFSHNDATAHKHFEIEVVGLLEKTGSFMDRLIFVPLEAYWAIPGHTEAGKNQVSGVWINLKARAAAMGLMLSQQWNRSESGVRFAWPTSRILADFWDEVGWTRELLAALAAGVTVLCVGLVIGIVSLMAERWRKPLAYLRILGVSRSSVVASVLIFGILCQFCGLVTAVVTYSIVGMVCTQVLNKAYLIVFDIWEFDPVMWQYPLIYVLVCSAGFLVPAWLAYQTNPSDVLAEGFDA